MKKQLLTLTAIALGAISFAAASNSAQAATINTGLMNAVQIDGQGSGFQKVHHRGRRNFRRHRHFRHFHGYYGYGYGGCYWLKRKAYRTGSHYFWRKYRACIRGWY